MPDHRREELDQDPEALAEKYCPACGELRPVSTKCDAHGIKRHFCAKCQALLAEEADESFGRPAPDLPDD